jgi:uncharacterized protein
VPDEATNPFRFGALALDDAFTDREAEIAELKSDTRNGQDVVVFAPRRYGKSSLVWRVAQELVSEGVLVTQLDLMTTPTKEKLAEKLAKAIHDDVASPLFRARERLNVFRGLRITPIVTVDPADGSLAFTFQAGRTRADVDATLEHLLELPGRLGAERGRKVALVLDEFQEVVTVDRDLPKLMRAVFQAQPEVAHLYLGSKRHLMDRIFNDENEPFWRSAKLMELGVIEPHVFRGYVSERFRKTGRNVAEAAVDRVLAITRGHPYATQELCYFLWEQTAAGTLAGNEHVARALESVLRSEYAHFSLVWDKAATAQRLLLQALAAEPGRPLRGDYRSRHGLPTASSVQRALEALVQGELVARDEEGGYRIVEPFLAEWIRLRDG